MHGPKPDNSCGKAFGVLCGRCFPAKTFPVISHGFVSQVCSEVGQESSAPSYTSLEALLFGGVRLGVQKVQWQPHPARFTTDHSTWLWALNCSWLQHHLSHQSRVWGSLLPPAQAPRAVTAPGVPLAALFPVITSKAWTPTALDTPRHPIPSHHAWGNPRS